MSQVPSLVLSPPLLLATDGSSSAQLAQRLMRLVAPVFLGYEREEGRSLLTVLTVLPRSSSRSNNLLRRKVALPSSSRNSLPNTTSQTTKSDEFVPSLESLTALVRPDFPANFSLALEIRQGKPATEILNYARTIDAGLIVVGHRGTGSTRELLLGNVAAAIARYAPCSVLIARQDATPREGLNHVMVMVDGSAAAQQAIAAIQQLIGIGIQRITLIHVQIPVNSNYLIGPFVSPNPSWQLSQSLQNAQQEAGKEVLQQAQAALSFPNINIQARLQSGDPGPTICHLAQELGADLLVLGCDPRRRTLRSPLQAFRDARRGEAPRPALRNTRLSITEDYAIHYAPCPVLLCRRSLPLE
ncbi:universal stress protein [Phormidium sp. CLA17]|uniref:universal stress protein n=1 Tax=Leptolyngbya sp. Cla-17 TaxID=2803751 RepID=UPI00149149B0|nr:universal stress protein [Leptolyngbya sp. Cla-17]MBM0740434.1 universal stress protein [Leptolyngbya sp. Cla-17]